MRIFNDYAKYYDLIYHNKDYAGEVDYILRQLNKFGFNGQTIADFGCGSGKHAFQLALNGYQVYGIDNSNMMLSLAKENLEKYPNIQNKPVFINEDIRNFQYDTPFDAILGLFHVVSYQVSNQDLLSTFKSVKNNLREGGLFFFDFWHGTGVLTNLPVQRTKIFNADEISVSKESAPRLNFDKCTVTVDISMSISRKPSGEIIEVINESHIMRYLFLPELVTYLQQSDLEYLASYEWLTDNPLGNNSWYGCCLAKA